MSKSRYFPHLVGSLVLASATSLGLLHKWEPAVDPRNPEAHLIVYTDGIGKGRPLTVCSGLTNAVSKKKLVSGDKWTQAECDLYEGIALEELQTKLAMCFIVLPPQSVFDAATSHAWNFGVSKTCSSASMKEWNRHNYKQGCQLLAFQYDGKTPNWSYSDGKFVQGLQNRRQDEMKVCMKDVK